MGVTTVSANLDDEMLMVEYMKAFSPQELRTPISLTVELVRRTTTPVGKQLEVVLAAVAVPQEAVRYEDFVESAAIRWINPRYRDGLHVRLTENRVTPVVSDVPVLIAVDSVVTPVNPARDQRAELPQPSDELIGTFRPEVMHENDPGFPAGYNDVVPEPSLLSIVYSSDVDSLEYTQGDGLRYVVSTDGAISIQDQSWATENSTKNLVPNPGFSPSTQPWELHAPGLAVSLLPYDTSLADVRKLRFSVSDPNPFSAMDQMVYSSAVFDLPSVAPAISMSAYLRLKDSASGQEVVFGVQWFGEDGVALTVDEESFQLQNSKYFVLHGARYDAPALAAKAKVFIMARGIVSRFSLELVWPQVEASDVYTSRVYPLNSTRVMNILTTTREVSLEFPLYAKVAIEYKASPTILGLIDTTSSLADGFQLAITGDRLSLVAYDGIGNAEYLSSDPFVATTNASFGVWIGAGGQNVEFYVDDTLLSSHALATPLGVAADRRILVGCLHQSNKTCQTKIVSFLMSRMKP